MPVLRSVQQTEPPASDRPDRHPREAVWDGADAIIFLDRFVAGRDEPCGQAFDGDPSVVPPPAVATRGRKRLLKGSHYGRMGRMVERVLQTAVD
jgi:hypothetical protein